MTRRLSRLAFASTVALVVAPMFLPRQPSAAAESELAVIARSHGPPAHGPPVAVAMPDLVPPNSPASTTTTSLPASPSVPHAKASGPSTIVTTTTRPAVPTTGATTTTTRRTTTTTSATKTTTSNQGTDLGSFYLTCYNDTGTTASGAPAGPDEVAVDPNVIPLGTHLRINGVGDRWARDTGGAVKGHHIDVWEPSSVCPGGWGNHNAEVYRIP